MSKKCPYCGEASGVFYSHKEAYVCGTICRESGIDTRGLECLRRENAALREQLAEARTLLGDEVIRIRTQAVAKARREAMEEAAKVCDRHAAQHETVLAEGRYEKYCDMDLGDIISRCQTEAEDIAADIRRLAQQGGKACGACGKPESDPQHIRYGPDLDNPRKHEFEPQHPSDKEPDDD